MLLSNNTPNILKIFTYGPLPRIIGLGYIPPEYLQQAKIANTGGAECVG